MSSMDLLKNLELELSLEFELHHTIILKDLQDV